MSTKGELPDCYLANLGLAESTMRRFLLANPVVAWNGKKVIFSESLIQQGHFGFLSLVIMSRQLEEQ